MSNVIFPFQQRPVPPIPGVGPIEDRLRALESAQQIQAGWFDLIQRRFAADSKVTTKSAAFTPENEIERFRVSASSGAVTATVPLAASHPGRTIEFIKTDSTTNAVTLSRSGSDTISGATSYVIPAQYRSVSLQSDGISSWDVVATSRQRVRVEEFGAVADDSTNNTTAIQAALDSLGSGGIAEFGPGTYRFTTLTVSDGIILRGAGNRATTLKTTNSTGNVITVAANGVHFDGLGFDCTATRTTGAYILIDGYRYGSIRNTYLTKYFIGYDLDNAVGWDIENTTALDGTKDATAANGAIIRLGTSAYTGGINIRGLIGDSTVAADQPTDGINIQYADVVTMDGVLIIHHKNSCRINPGSGETASLINIVNSSFDTASQNGLRIIPGASGTVTRVSVANSWMGACTSDGVYIDGSSGDVDGVQFVNCRAHSNGGVGYNITGANAVDVSLHNCNAAGNTSHGIQVQTGAPTGIHIIGGTYGACDGLSGNGAYGIAIGSTGVTGSVLGAALGGNTSGRITNSSPTGFFQNSKNIIHKLADETLTTNTTYQDDDVLKFSVAASTKYKFCFRVFYDTPAAADIKFQLTGPSSPTVLSVAFRPQTTGGVVSGGYVMNSAFSTSVVCASADTKGMIVIDGILQNGANAGTVVLQWAQNSSSGTTTVYAGSKVEWEIIG